MYLYPKISLKLNLLFFKKSLYILYVCVILYNVKVFDVNLPLYFISSVSLLIAFLSIMDSFNGL